MIELSQTTALTVYLFISLTLLLSILIYQHFFSIKRKVRTDRERLLVCEYCHFAYLGEIGSELTQCPQCSSFNKNNTYKK
jgi:protein-arginine kinase activator protein McsA